jgi:hypothetical protein
MAHCGREGVPDGFRAGAVPLEPALFLLKMHPEPKRIVYKQA